jgi:hypothetical protein
MRARIIGNRQRRGVGSRFLLSLVILMRLPDRGDRRDQARVIVFDVANPQAHQSAYHFFRKGRGEQNLELGHIRRRFAKPNRPGGFSALPRLTVVKIGTDRRGSTQQQGDSACAGDGQDGTYLLRVLSRNR